MDAGVTDPSSSGSAAGSVGLVVPIHNMAEHLAECLTSIEAQTIFDELQVVLVDDGSTDASPEIAAEFAARHDNVVLHREPNRGPGAARNRGLREVTAPFVAFCDSDDRLPPDALATLRGILLEHDADVALGALETFPRRRAWPWFEHLDADSRLVPGVEHAPGLVHSAGPCDKLFRTEALRRMGLSFAEGTHFEDAYVSVPVLLAADRIAVTQKVVYHYRLRAGSIMRSLWTREANFWDHLALQEFLSRLRPGLPERRRAVLDLFMVRSFQGFAMRAPDRLDGPDLRSFYDRCVAVFGQAAPEVIAEACVGTRHRVAFVAFLLGDRELFEDRRSRIAGLDVVGDHLQLRLRGEVPDRLRALLRVDRTHVVLEAVDAVEEGRTLRLTGRMALDGLTMAGPPAVETALELPGCGPAHPARVVGRRWRADADNDWNQFTAELPTGSLTDGVHPVRLVLRSPGGSVVLPVSAATGALRAARTLQAGGHRLLVLREGTGVVLRAARAATRRARARWAARLLVDDVRHIRGRGPLWRARLTRLLTAPVSRSDAWLLAEVREGGPDNATALFRYLREHRPDIRARYVAGSAEEAGELRGLGGVVVRGSRRHRALMLRAAVLLTAHDADACLLPPQWPKGQYLQHLAWRIGSRRVFLQHGLGYDPADPAWHRGTAGVDLVLTSSAPEADAVRSEQGYADGQVAVTGLPRFDLLDRPPSGRRVLVVPGTGAGDLDPPTASFWRDVLRDADLLEALDRTGTTLEVLSLGDLTADGTPVVPDHHRVVLGEAGVRPARDAILDCSLFVTDRCALGLDAAEARRPVLLAGPGPLPVTLAHLDGAASPSRTPADLVAAIRRCLEDTSSSAVAPSALLPGGGNCARVTEAIEALLRRSGAPVAVTSAAEPPVRSVPLSLS